MGDEPKKRRRQPKLTKARLKEIDVEHIDQVMETWMLYHQNLMRLLSSDDSSPEEIEEQRDFSTCYYEAILDLLIAFRSKPDGPKQP